MKLSVSVIVTMVEMAHHAILINQLEQANGEFRLICTLEHYK